MFRSAIGHAEGIDTNRVVNRALEQLAENLNGDVPKALIVFSSSEFDHSVMLRAITQAYPNTPISGGTTLGEFSMELGVSDDSILITALVCDTISFVSAAVEEISTDPAQTIQLAWRDAVAALGESPKLCLVFPEAHTNPAGRVLRVLADLVEAEDSCVLAGGLVGSDPSSIRPPVQFHESGPLSHGLVFMLAGGPLTTYAAACQNWHEVGPKATVTSAEGPIIHTINGQPAAQYYRNYLGPDAPPLEEFPLSIMDKNSDTPVVRGVLGIDDTNGFLRVSDDVTDGATVRLTKVKPQFLLEGVHDTFRNIPREVVTHSAIALSFSCGARRNLLGTDSLKEIKTLKHALPCFIPIVGFYSFGEVGPLEQGSRSGLHNHTLITLFLGEENAPSVCEPHVVCCQHKIKHQPTIDGLQHENEFLTRKLARSEFHLKNMENHRAAWLNLMINLQLGLRKSEEKYRRIVETCIEGFLLLGKDGRIEYANESWLRLVGHSWEEVIGAVPSAFTQTDEIDSLLYELTEVAPYWRRETSVVHKTGHRIPVLITASVLTGDSGDLMGYFLFVTNLTEQKKALLLAGQFQQSLFPKEAPDIPGLELAGRSDPCDEVGGDYFDYINNADGPCALVVADVSGHGVDASLLMSSVRTYLRSHPSNKDNLGEMVSSLNAQLAQDVSQSGRFVTLFHLLADSVTNDLVWVRAGHDPAWVYDPETDTFSQLKGVGLPLGVLEDTRYTANILQSRPKNAIIIIGTDGIWESNNIHGEMFGKERFLDIIRAHADKDAHTIRDNVFDAVREFSHGVRVSDDMTLVIAKFHEDTNPLRIAKA